MVPNAPRLYVIAALHRSGEFHTYRAHRRREMHRVAEMDEEMREEEATSKLRSAMEKVIVLGIMCSR